MYDEAILEARSAAMIATLPVHEDLRKMSIRGPTARSAVANGAASPGRDPPRAEASARREVPET